MATECRRVIVHCGLGITVVRWAMTLHCVEYGGFHTKKEAQLWAKTQPVDPATLKSH